MKEIKTVGVIGLGALGTLYAVTLTQALGKAHVLVLADRIQCAKGAQTDDADGLEFCHKKPLR